MAMALVLTGRGLASGPRQQQHQGVATRLSPSGQLLVRGLDAAGHRLFVEDSEKHLLLQSDDWGATFAQKGLPRGVDSVAKVLLFKSRLYALGRDTRNGRVGVYSAAPTAGNARLRWSRARVKFSPSSTALGTNFNSDSHYLYAGEYGDPRPAPRVYRSADGIHWHTSFGPGRGIRHIHGVAADPYRPGDVWMTVGDGVHAVYFSSRYGAPGSWRVVVPSAAWQSVQISFTRSRIYLAADTHSKTFFVLDRKRHKPHLGTPEYYANKQPPGSPPGTRYLFNAFFGAVDPGTGIYYCVANDNSEGIARPGKGFGGEWQGLFAVRRIGDPVRIVDPGGPAISMNGEVFVGGGRIWSGQWSVPALH
jgi:hypothetical protein